MPNPITIITDDHRSVESLFKEFEALGDTRTSEKETIAKQIIKELTIHADMEENNLYPKLKEVLVGDDAKLIEEARAEHHIANVVLLELKVMSVENPQFIARMKVLKENVMHHIKEEEEKILPLASKALTSLQLERLGSDMEEYKKNAHKSFLERIFSP